MAGTAAVFLRLMFAAVFVGIVEGLFVWAGVVALGVGVGEDGVVADLTVVVGEALPASGPVIVDACLDPKPPPACCVALELGCCCCCCCSCAWLLLPRIEPKRNDDDLR